MTRDSQIARIAAALCSTSNAPETAHESTSEAIDRVHGVHAAALYDAGLRAALPVDGLRALDNEMAWRSDIIDAIALGLHKTRVGNDVPEFDMEKADERAEAIWGYVMPVLDAQPRAALEATE